MVQVHSCRAIASGTSLLRERQAALAARPHGVGLYRKQRYGASRLLSPKHPVCLGLIAIDPPLNDIVLCECSAFAVQGLVQEGVMHTHHLLKTLQIDSLGLG